MAAMTDFLENKLIDFLFRGQALGITGATAAAGTGPTNLYFGLFTNGTTIVDAGTGGTEVAGGSYARVAVPSNMTAAGWAGTQATASTAASSGTGATTSNNAAITFPAPSANWGVINQFAVFDAITGGNMLIYGTLTTPKTINSGDAPPAFSAAAFSFQLDN